MYFQSSELDDIVQEWGEPTAKEIRALLKEIRAELTEDATGYRSFGGYWAELKPLVYARKTPSPADVVPVLPAALAYRALQEVNGPAGLHEESLFHLWEYEQGDAELISVYDAGLEGSREGQLDLFQDIEEQEKAARAFLTSPQDFLPRTWKEHGDRALMDGEFHAAVRCYKRAALLSQDYIYRGEMWLAMGLALESAEHHRKALLCFENAYEKAQEGWILGHIAQSCQSLGRLSEARRYYREALEHMPGNPEYQSALEYLDGLAKMKQLDELSQSRSA